MQRVLSCCSNDKKPPLSQDGLAIPERDKLQMEIESRGAVSFSWSQAKQIAAERRSPKWNWKIWKLLENGRAVPAVA